MMDPQFRIFHECVWTALEDAGYDPFTYKGQIGLYTGAGLNAEWVLRALQGQSLRRLKDAGNSRFEYERLHGNTYFL